MKSEELLALQDGQIFPCCGYSRCRIRTMHIISLSPKQRRRPCQSIFLAVNLLVPLEVVRSPLRVVPSSLPLNTAGTSRSPYLMVILKVT